MLIHLIKPLKKTTVSYVAQPLVQTSTHIVVRALWTRPAVDLGYMNVAPGDFLDEYFYQDQWFNVFAWYTATGRLRGWYCNVTRPANVHRYSLTSVDLELDLFVAADRHTMTRLDVDEFESRAYNMHDPVTYRAGYDALTELESRARLGSAPFDRTQPL